MFSIIKRIYYQIIGKKNVRPLLKNGAIIPAFECNGVQYYQFAQPLGLAVGRWIAVSAALERAQTGCTKEQLGIFLKVMKAASEKGDMKTVKEQLAHMQVRMEWAFEPETAYELAATMFFDLNEDPAVPDDAYTRYKIAEFKKNLHPDFFLQVPFSSILTISASSYADFHLYTLDRLKDLLSLYQQTLVGPYSYTLTNEEKSLITLQVQQASQLTTQFVGTYGNTI